LTTLAQKQTLRNLLNRKIGKRRLVKYITEFPYTVKTNKFIDGIPKWKLYNNEDYPRFENRKWDDKNMAFVIQDKSDGTVYNWFNVNFIDGHRTTDRDKRWFEDDVMPILKSNEDKLPYRILGWGWGFKPRYCKQFQRAGDQFLKFFEEYNDEYYVGDPVFAYGTDVKKFREFNDDAGTKHIDYWKNWNYTKENLGVYP
jgi:hypothetical protein